MNRLRRTSAAYASGGLQNPNSVRAGKNVPGKKPDACPMTSAIKDDDEMAEDSPVEKTQTTESPAENNTDQERADSMDDAIVENVYVDISTKNGGNGKIPFKEIFLKRKKSSERIRDKKLRQNRQLRKSMLPKNALMALNEVKGVTISDFIIESDSHGGFTALVTVNSNQYEGKGLSKMSAKNAACEKAWRDFIIAKMKAKSPKQKPVSGDEVTADGHAEDDAMETNESDAESQDDELPMLNLASFAIYKLFSEWEREGFPVPQMHPSASTAVADGKETAPLAPVGPKEPKKPPIRTELPAGWETLHPASLLSIVDYSFSKTVDFLVYQTIKIKHINSETLLFWLS
uniref:Uncharacterized protein LOC108041744 isoform X1 n=1 Tax=Drosophila rhopaloa TaxID=1041015 RepID=A0A6P4EAV2_DRORH